MGPFFLGSFLGPETMAQGWTATSSFTGPPKKVWAGFFPKISLGCAFGWVFFGCLGSLKNILEFYLV